MNVSPVRIRCRLVDVGRRPVSRSGVSSAPRDAPCRDRLSRGPGGRSPTDGVNISSRTPPLRGRARQPAAGRAGRRSPRRLGRLDRRGGDHRGHGLDISDEGFYLLSYRWWDINLRTFTGVQYVYGPVFELLGFDIARLRLFRLGTIVVTHAALGFAFMRWLRTRRPEAPATPWWEAAGTAAVVACGGLVYGWLPLSPGYNDVALLGSMLLTAGVLWAAADVQAGRPHPGLGAAAARGRDRRHGAGQVELAGAHPGRGGRVRARSCCSRAGCGRPYASSAGPWSVWCWPWRPCTFLVVPLQRRDPADGGDEPPGRGLLQRPDQAPRPVRRVRRGGAWRSVVTGHSCCCSSPRRRR